MSASTQDTPELRQWIIRQTEAGHSPQTLLAQLVSQGYAEETAVTIMTATLESRLAEIRSRTANKEIESGIPVPQPIGTAWPSVVHALDREVKVLFSLALPRVVLFGGLLSDKECDELIALSRPRVTPSNVVDLDSGGEKLHADRTSSGAALTRGGTPLISRLEQRIGRIKRFGQRRATVDMLNLVFEQTVDEKIYERLSERMKNRYDLFGSLPDTIKDEWIDDIETLDERLDEYINAQKTATGFDLRYTGTMMPPDKDWREFREVLSRRDLVTLMSAAWR